MTKLIHNNTLKSKSVDVGKEKNEGTTSCDDRIIFLNLARSDQRRTFEITSSPDIDQL